MRAETVFILIVAILIADFILERILSFLNYKSLGQAVPDELKGTYDEEKYAKQQKYEKENIRFSVISSVFSSILIFLMLFFDGFAFVDSFARSISADPVLSALIFFGILLITFDLINSPFEIYDIFVIEQKYGFNKTTPLTYFLDKIKGWLIGGIIGGMSNGQNIVVRLTVKPVPSTKKQTETIDIVTKEKTYSHYERSDTCVVPNICVIARNMIATVVLNAIDLR